jgi:hypothetical protein
VIEFDISLLNVADSAATKKIAQMIKKVAALCDGDGITAHSITIDVALYVDMLDIPTIRTIYSKGAPRITARWPREDVDLHALKTEQCWLMRNITVNLGRRFSSTSLALGKLSERLKRLDDAIYAVAETRRKSQGSVIFILKGEWRPEIAAPAPVPIRLDCGFIAYQEKIRFRPLEATKLTSQNWPPASSGTPKLGR